MSVLLNDDEIGALVCDSLDAMYSKEAQECRDIAKAQLKKVFTWGSEPCPHREYTIHKRCGLCWQTLLEEGE